MHSNLEVIWVVKLSTKWVVSRWANHNSVRGFSDSH